MKKELLMALLCGMLLPLAVAAAAGWASPPAEQPADPEEQETRQTEQTLPEQTDRDVELRVRKEDGQIQQMDLERYLLGVVLAEMPAEFEPEALKAQAVVARTYTCRRMKQGRHDDAAVCTDPGCCQAFREEDAYRRGGGSAEAVEKVRQAVRETAGMVLRYEGELIDATYFSCSGGMTEDAVEVWGQDIPYLRSVESPGEENAPRFQEERRFSARELCGLLGISGTGPMTDWFSEPVRTAGGGVERMEICGKEFTGQALRQLLQLRSTAFRVEAGPEEAVFLTRGFGHRVGMSQYGAQAMALEGKTFRQILSHYYQGTELGTVFPENP